MAQHRGEDDSFGASQTRTVLSQLPAARRLPSALNATGKTRATGAAAISRAFALRIGVPPLAATHEPTNSPATYGCIVNRLE